mgnify:CR=1 FL=1
MSNNKFAKFRAIQIALFRVKKTKNKKNWKIKGNARNRVPLFDICKRYFAIFQFRVKRGDEENRWIEVRREKPLKSPVYTRAEKERGEPEGGVGIPLGFSQNYVSSCFMSHLWRDVCHWNPFLVKMQSNSDENKGKQDSTTCYGSFWLSLVKYEPFRARGRFKTWPSYFYYLIKPFRNPPVLPVFLLTRKLR